MESPVPPQVFTGMAAELGRLRMAAQLQTAATLTAAVVAAAESKLSLEQILAIQKDFYFAMHPEPGSSAYKEWQKNSAQALRTVYP
jgi:hypothetical protein